MFGRNDFIENIKDALAAAGCDMGAFRSWQKQYDRLKKKQKEQKERYERCREQTKRVQEDAQLMEQMLIAEQTADRKEFGRLLKDLRQMQNNFDHEDRKSACTFKGESGKRGTKDRSPYVLLSVGIGSGTSTAATGRKTGKNYIFL